MINEIIIQTVNMFRSVFNPETYNVEILFSVLAQLFVIFAVLYGIYQKFIKGTSSERLVKGIFILIIGWLCGEILIKFNLNILGAFLRASIGVVAISLVVIFQPELRRFISFIGQTNFLKRAFFSGENNDYDKKVNMLKELTETVKYLSKTKTGGLIVLQTNETDSTYSEVGTKIDANVSAELLLTIFFPNTPLHDGAVVIKNDKIALAGVLLPLTEDPKLSWRYGTRHRAAIGVTEINDCAAIVVSEETGDISIALDGVLKKYESITAFKDDLSKILKIEQENSQERLPKKVFEFINFKPNENKAKK